MPVHKILIVDDSATERQVMIEALSKSGYECVTAADGKAAIAKSRSEMPDLILMDVVMPGVNGFQATRTIARDATTSHIPIIMCTGKSAETDKVWGLRQGAREYLVKPIDTQDLLQRIVALP